MTRKQKLVLGADCGGTNLKLALIEPSGAILYSKRVPVNFTEAPQKVICGIGKEFKKFLKESRVSEILGIGMGIAGDVDQQKGIVRFSPNLNWKQVPLKQILSKEFPYPLLIENDANCAAWGAYCLDAKKDCKNLICLTLGTGIGGGIILNGKLFRGSRGSAGEIGHMTIEYRGRPCKCGNFGCTESMIGAWGLIQTAQDGLKKGLAPILKKILSKSKGIELNPETIEEAAAQGDGYCRQIWDEAGEILGCTLSNLVNLFNPDRIILCGGVSKARSWILKPALHTLAMRAFKTPLVSLRVSISQYDEKLGVVGAGLLFWE